MTTENVSMLKFLVPIVLLCLTMIAIGWISHSYHATRREIAEYLAEQRRSAPFEPKAPKCPSSPDGKHRVTARYFDRPGNPEWVCLHCGVIKDNGGK